MAYYGLPDTVVIAEGLTSGSSAWVPVHHNGNVVFTTGATGGTYGGATLTIQSRLMAYPSTSISTLDPRDENYPTEPGNFVAALTTQHEVRATLTGGTSPSVNVYMTRYDN